MYNTQNITQNQVHIKILHGRPITNWNLLMDKKGTLSSEARVKWRRTWTWSRDFRRQRKWSHSDRLTWLPKFHLQKRPKVRKGSPIWQRHVNCIRVISNLTENWTFCAKTCSAPTPRKRSIDLDQHELYSVLPTTLFWLPKIPKWPPFWGIVQNKFLCKVSNFSSNCKWLIQFRWRHAGQCSQLWFCQSWQHW